MHLGTITRLAVLAAMTVSLLVGCSRSQYRSARSPRSEKTSVDASARTSGRATEGQKSIPAGQLVQTSLASKPNAPRKLIYNAKIRLETADLKAYSQDLEQQLEQLDGFVSNYSERRYSGDSRRGTWVVRIPSDNFQPLLSWLDQKYSIVDKEVSSEDVTEEYVDLSARLSNKKNTEDRLAKVLDERSGKLEEVLAVEREIDRVREEIERIEGRLRFLTEQVSLSTVTLTVNTRAEYTPVHQEKLGSRAGNAWNQSVSDLRSSGENLTIGAAGMAPWLPIILCAFAVGFFVLRFAARRLYRLASSPVAFMFSGQSQPAASTTPSEK